MSLSLQTAVSPQLHRLRLCLWLYLALLLLEGPLRKWLLPGLSTPLLLLRDPVALLAVFWGWGLLRRSTLSPFWIALSLLSLASFMATLVVGHGDLPTAVFGLRVWLLHVPLIFLYAEAFTLDDVWRAARVLLLLAPPMALLMYLQGTLPEAHFLNRAPGGEGAALFSGAEGIPRPPGIFTFINGLAGYLGLAMSLAIAWLLAGPRPLPAWLWLALAALVAALPLSISRTLLFHYAMVGIAAVVFLLLARRGLVRFMSYGVALALLVLLLLVAVPQLQPFISAFQTRWEQASAIEGGEQGVGGVLLLRVLDPLLRPLEAAWTAPLLGEGMGLGTNVGAVRLGGDRAFLVGEEAWEATFRELGPFFGTGVLLVRTGLTLTMLEICLAQAARGKATPLLLGAVVLPWVLFGIVAQPTSLSLMVIGAGLLLASARPTTPAALLAGGRYIVKPLAGQ